MINWFLILTLSVTLLSQPAIAQNSNPINKKKTQGKVNKHRNGTAVQKLTWQLLSTYSPDSYFLLDQYYKSRIGKDELPISGEVDFSVWIDGDTENDIVKSLNTVVHEMDHCFTSSAFLKILEDSNQPVEGDNYSAFYLGNGETRVVKHSGVFVSKEINSVFPKSLITSRYETYVFPSEIEMSSQQDGVYGLIDEWNAYYHGTKVSFDLYNYYKNKRNDADGWAEFFTDYYGTFYAYLEFKSYILVYLMYAKRNYHHYYKGFMSNKDLLYSIKRIDENWKSIIIKFRPIKTKILADLNSRGMDVEEKNGFIFINGSGSGNFSEIYNMFQEELRKPEYQEMAHALGLEYAGGPGF